MLWLWLVEFSTLTGSNLTQMEMSKQTVQSKDAEKYLIMPKTNRPKMIKSKNCTHYVSNVKLMYYC